ncbi:MAG: aldo/keto reductase [Chloroflexi bacterium]|nr:MAG: aldo/keto reductase [Chloroflexota bacterium]TMG68859.1 MAG: aldo/keto reductase [Chloroflexota bacterium]
MNPMRTTTLPGGTAVPLLGQGTWRMGEDREHRRREVSALRTGMELGMTLIDTAEMYADGGAERVVGEAIRGRRDDVFIVSKLYPQNATPERMRKACERSLKRLGTERIDLYLLHWRGDVALRRMLDGFAQLLADEKIAYAGVSNFDVQDMDELARLKDGLDIIVANEVLYNLEKRGIEYDLLPWMRKRHRPVIAYSPIEEGLLAGGTHRALASIAERHDATAAQVSLAWVVRDGDVIAIPKAATVAHVKQNRGAVDLKLTARDLDELDESFAPPEERMPLATR